MCSWAGRPGVGSEVAFYLPLRRKRSGSPRSACSSASRSICVRQNEAEGFSVFPERPRGLTGTESLPPSAGRGFEPRPLLPWPGAVRALPLGSVGMRVSIYLVRIPPLSERVAAAGRLGTLGLQHWLFVLGGAIGQAPGRAASPGRSGSGWRGCPAGGMPGVVQSCVTFPGNEQGSLRTWSVCS